MKAAIVWTTLVLAGCYGDSGAATGPSAPSAGAGGGAAAGSGAAGTDCTWDCNNFIGEPRMRTLTVRVHEGSQNPISFSLTDDNGKNYPCGEENNTIGNKPGTVACTYHYNPGTHLNMAMGQHCGDYYWTFEPVNKVCMNYGEKESMCRVSLPGDADLVVVAACTSA